VAEAGVNLLVYWHGWSSRPSRLIWLEDYKAAGQQIPPVSLRSRVGMTRVWVGMASGSRMRGPASHVSRLAWGAFVLLKGSQNPHPAAKSTARMGTHCDFIARDFGTDDFGRTFAEGYMVLILM
jgi:hypothetical protein